MPRDPYYSAHLEPTYSELVKLTAKHQLEYRRRELSSRMRQLMNTICDMFDDDNTLQPQPQPAQDFQHLYDEFSPPTVTKAKRLLKIHSRRKDGIWWWLPPQRTPQGAADYVNKIRCNDKDGARKALLRSQRDSVEYMRGLMKSENYYALNHHIEQGMKQAGYSHITISRARKDARVHSIYDSGKWYWVMEAPAVEVWLHHKLSQGWMDWTLLQELAMREYQWVPSVLLQILRRPYGFKMVISNKRIGWIDMTPQQPLPLRSETASREPLEEWP
jgi:hypothetical protein